MTDKPRGPRLTDRQRVAWLRLIRTERVGPATFRDLVNRFGSAEAAIEALPDLMLRVGAKPPRIPTSGEAAAEIEQAARSGAAYLAIGEPDYPPWLRTMDHPPPLLAVAGTPQIFNRPTMAIVGARNASVNGVRFARQMAMELGNAGFTVASGLARGIDRGAHEGSLATGTIAVLAGGIDQPYPPENADLYSRIISGGGAIVSEMPFGWQPRARDFPRRNRIIAGLAHGLLVVEAAQRSGSLISARLAGEMGRLVFAVPGSPLDPRTQGTNGLLKDGAILVTELRDIIDQMTPMLARPAPPPALEEPPDLYNAAAPDGSERERVTEALGPSPVSVDEIIRHTGLHPAQVYLVLMELDLAGQLERHPGGAVSLLYPN